MKKWISDPAHSEVGFKVKHLMITNVKGSFKDFNLEVTTESDVFDSPQVRFSARTASVDTGNEQRDQHLRSADFFDSEKYAEMTFSSNRYTKIDVDSFEMEGDLTIKNITKPIKLSVEFGGVMKDPWGNMKAGFTVSAKLNRKDWDLNWNAALEAGGMLVSDEVRISADIQLIENKEGTNA